MKLVDSSVISEPVEFIFDLLSVVGTKHFLFAPMKLQFYSEHSVDGDFELVLILEHYFSGLFATENAIIVAMTAITSITTTTFTMLSDGPLIFKSFGQ